MGKLKPTSKAFLRFVWMGPFFALLGVLQYHVIFVLLFKFILTYYPWLIAPTAWFISSSLWVIWYHYVQCYVFNEAVDRGNERLWLQTLPKAFFVYSFSIILGTVLIYFIQMLYKHGDLVPYIICSLLTAPINFVWVRKIIQNKLAEK